jgi:hypothetical protein
MPISVIAVRKAWWTVLMRVCTSPRGMRRFFAIWAYVMPSSRTSRCAPRSHLRNDLRTIAANSRRQPSPFELLRHPLARRINDGGEVLRIAPLGAATAPAPLTLLTFERDVLDDVSAIVCSEPDQRVLLRQGARSRAKRRPALSRQLDRVVMGTILAVGWSSRAFISPLLVPPAV